MSTINLERLAIANQILALFPCSARIERRQNGRLYVTEGSESIPAIVDGGGSLSGRYDLVGMGGTRAYATGLLLLWVRNEPRRPLSSWEHICGPGPNLGSGRGNEILDLLRTHGYEDPALTCCHWCKRTDVRLDWFAHYRVPGCADSLAGDCVKKGRVAA